MLKDDLSRSQIFSETILMDRWVSLDKHLTAEKNISKKARLSVNPEVKLKHLHMQEYYTNEETYLRRVFVHKSKQSSFHEFKSQKVKRR